MVAQPKLKRVISKILKSVGVTLLATIVAGFIYEEVGRMQDRKRLPQIGRSVDIGGRSLNISRNALRRRSVTRRCRRAMLRLIPPPASEIGL